MTALVALLAVAPAQSADADLRREIERVFKAWSSSWSREDVPALARMLHPGGQTVGLDGTVWPFSRARQDLTSMFAGMRKVTMQVRIDRLERHGDEVVAWITTRSAYETKIGGRWQRRSYTSRDADTLKRFTDGWKFVYSQALP